MTTLFRNIIIWPNQLNDIKSFNFIINSHINDNFLNVLSDDGFLYAFSNVNLLSSGEVLDNGSIVYNISFLASLYKLNVMDSMMVSISNITSFGIYALDINSPDSSLASFFIPISKINDISSYELNISISIVIDAIRVKQNQYLCLCSLSHSTN